MAEVLLIKDKPETIFEPRDFEYLLDKYLGYDASRYFRNLVEELQVAADMTEAKVNTDLDSYQSSLESNTVAFQEIQEEVLGILKYCHEISNYPIKFKAVQPIMERLKEVKKIINNQI